MACALAYSWREIDSIRTESGKETYSTFLCHWFMFNLCINLYQTRAWKIYNLYFWNVSCSMWILLQRREISLLIMWSRFSLFTLNHVYVSDIFVFFAFFHFSPFYTFLLERLVRLFALRRVTSMAADFTSHWFTLCWSVNRRNQRRILNDFRVEKRWCRFKVPTKVFRVRFIVDDLLKILGKHSPGMFLWVESNIIEPAFDSCWKLKFRVPTRPFDLSSLKSFTTSANKSRMLSQLKTTTTNYETWSDPD